jgi:hypothetical protein
MSMSYRQILVMKIRRNGCKINLKKDTVKFRLI